MNIEGAVVLAEDELEMVSGGKMISKNVTQEFIGVGGTKDSKSGSLQKDKSRNVVSKGITSLDGVKVC